MKANIILGYVLVLAGVLVVGFVLYDAFLVFKGAKEITSFIDLAQRFDTAKPSSPEIDFKNLDLNNLGEVLQEMSQNQLKTIIPPQAIEKVIDSILYSAISFVLIYGGSKIASLGVSLLRSNKDE